MVRGLKMSNGYYKMSSKVIYRINYLASLDAQPEVNNNNNNNNNNPFNLGDLLTPKRQDNLFKKQD
jgi:hypothetical protein